MTEILEKLFKTVVLGKADARSAYPSELKGFEGSYENTGAALMSVPRGLLITYR